MSAMAPCGAQLMTYVRHFLWVSTVQDLVQHVYRSLGLDGDTCTHALGMYVFDHVSRTGLLVAVRLRCLCSCRRDGSLVVEAVEITSGILECLHPLLRLWCWLARQPSYRASSASVQHTSAIIIWQSNVPFPSASLGRFTCGRTIVTTGAPNVMFGTKWPSIMSTCSQSAP
jgi:hypothetical protein